MPQYNWQRGDTLSTVAAAHGLEGWRRIWNEPSNSALRTLRGSPENLRAGDVINIPDPRPGEVSRPVEARHRFVRLGVPPASIRSRDMLSQRSRRAISHNGTKSAGKPRQRCDCNPAWQIRLAGQSSALYCKSLGG